MTQPNGDTVPIPPVPPVIPGNGEEIAGSPWLTDPNHPRHKDHGKNPEPGTTVMSSPWFASPAPDTLAPGIDSNGVLRANVIDGAIVALPEVTSTPETPVTP